MKYAKHYFKIITSKQFLTYLCTGTAANVIDIGLFYILIWSGFWYVGATIVSGTIGFFAAFFLHKYVVFGKKDQMVGHFFKFCMLGLFNLGAMTLFLYVLVEFLNVPEEFAKIISNGSVVLWNFFVYKFIIYI